MVLTKRQKDILVYLCSQREYVSVKQLASKFGVSPRTIQSDFAFIDSFLSDSEMIIDRKPSKGIKVNADEAELTKLRKELGIINSRALDSYERLTVISLLLLCNPIITFEQLANACCVSRQTIITAFKQVEEKFEEEGIEVQKFQGKGIRIIGDESLIRRSFENKLQNLISEEVVLGTALKNSRLMEVDEKAEEIMEMVEKRLNVRFAESLKLKLLLGYSLFRIGTGFTMPDNKRFNELEEIKTYKEYEILTDAMLSYQFSLSDKAYLCSLFMNAKIAVQSSNNFKTYLDDTDEAGIISKYLFNELQAIQPLEVSSREHFIRGLILHLRVAIYRIRNKVTIHNELLSQIKVSIPLIYEFTKERLLKCEKKFQLEFDENEIAFIAMYIAAAYENSFKIKTKLTVLLVCSFGIATSSILKTRILQAIPECIIEGPLPEREAREYLSKNEVNLIISTNDYRESSIPSIKVNPLLHPEDVDFIKNQLFQLSYAMMCQHFIKSYANFHGEEIGRSYVKDYVDREDIQIVETCSSWKDAVRLAAKPLLEKGSIKQRYVDKMIEAVEQFGTYMVLIPETAFIHAGTEDGINENCTAILVLKNPIIFGSKNSKIVRNLVVLGVKNKEDKSLLKLIYIFENRLNLFDLKSSKITIDRVHNMQGVEGQYEGIN
jgi:transcriptional antiterminator/mannitol/fructose-specific phosphotransferase system IIA component (Ntr-type)